MKRTLYVILSAAALLCCGSEAFGRQGSAPDNKKAVQVQDSTYVQASVIADSLINLSYNYLGRPYVYGAAGPKTFDCSGFTLFLYKKFGYHLHRSAKGQLKDGRPVVGDISQLQKGDLIFFTDKKNTRVGHVGLFIELDRENKSFKMIHAAKKGIMITTCSETYYKTRFCGARRLLPDFVPAHSLDSLTAPLDPDANIVVAPDTLSLGQGDSRMVLFANGSWLRVDQDGRMSVPEAGGDKIIVYPDGRWVSVPDVNVKIPVVDNDPVGNPLHNASNSPVNPASPSDRQYHVVKSGDTLGAIARKYHTTVAEICRLNNMKSTSVLKIGKRLIVK